MRTDGRITGAAMADGRLASVRSAPVAEEEEWLDVEAAAEQSACPDHDSPARSRRQAARLCSPVRIRREDLDSLLDRCQIKPGELRASPKGLPVVRSPRPIRPRREVKAGYAEARAVADRRCLRGKAKNALLTAWLLGGYNVRRCHSWARRPGPHSDGFIAKAPRKNRRGDRGPVCAMTG